jgi:hypothetical protein
MLTALPDRFYEAIGLAGFRVPQKSRTVQAPDFAKFKKRNASGQFKRALHAKPND